MTALRTWLLERRLQVLYGVLIAAIYIRNLYGLASAPPGFYVDESSIAYNAWAIAHYGADEHGRAFPLYFEAFGDYKNPVYIYTLALLSRIFGMSVFIERLPAAMFGLSACLFVALAVRRLTGSDVAAGITLLLAGLTPWLTLESRVGFEVVSMVAMLALMLWCLVEASARDSWRWYLGAGTAAAVAVYAYSTARLEVGLFAGAMVLSFTYPWRRRWWAALGPIFVGYAILGLWMLAHPGALTARYDLISITKNHATGVSRPLGQIWTMFWTNYWQYLSPDFLFVNGDSNLRHNTHWGGMLLWPMFALLIAGVTWCLVNFRDAMPRFLLLCMPAAPVAAALTDNGTPHALRSVTLLPLALVIAGCGAHALLRATRYIGVRWKVPQRAITYLSGGVAAAIATLLIVPGVAYNVDLYTAYPDRAASSFDTGELDAIIRARDAAGIGTVYLLDDGYLDQPSIQAAYLYEPAPPATPTEDNVPVLLGEMGMVQTRSIDPGTLRSGDVVVASRASALPAGVVLIYVNDYAMVGRAG